ncbi:MAG: hypothetical protein GX963_02670, partial [Bacteroidales bacterium]|nr:hypothetical protein [Bacteroidales bacterium]
FNPDDADLLYNLGYLAEEQGRNREAFDYYSKALENVQDEEFEAELLDALVRLRTITNTNDGKSEEKAEDIIFLVDKQLKLLNRTLSRGRK